MDRIVSKLGPNEVGPKLKIDLIFRGMNFYDRKKLTVLLFRQKAFFAE